jgi:hypothetical protein
MNKTLRYITLFVLIFISIPAVYAIKFVPTANPLNASENTVKKANELVSYIDSLALEVQKSGNYVENLLPDKTYTLPLGLVKSIGGVNYMIVLDDMVTDPTGMILSAYMKLEVPGTGKSIGLMADDVRVTLGGITSAKLKMLKDEVLPLGSSKSMAIYADRTFVEFDCAGYKQTSLSASVLFSRNLLIPIDGNGREISGNSRVKGLFTANFVDFNDLLIDITLSPFAVNGLKDFGFKITTASIDFSDLRNPIGMQFPENYISGGMMSPGDALWRGIYVTQFTVILPKKLGNRTDGQRVSISARNLIIDDSGVSGSFEATNIVTLEKGRLGSWNFSIDNIAVRIVQNNFASFTFAGKVKLPVGENKQSILGYTAFIDADNRYQFAAEVNDKLEFDIFASELTLTKDSYIEVKDLGDRFTAKAVLNGTMNISSSKKSKESGKPDSKVKITGIAFQELTIQNVAPNIDAKYFGVRPGQLAGFPINVKEIAFKKYQSNRFGLYFDIMLNFVNDSDGGFGAETAFTIVGKVEQKLSGGNDYLFDGVELNKIWIDINQSAFSLKGGIVFYREDPVYGTGFKGMVDARFTPGLKLSAMVQFGSVDGFRYWFADAMVTLPFPIVVSPALGFYGFGGGAYYHMKQVVSDEIVFNNDMAGNVGMETGTDLEPGRSLSGVKYVPDKRVSLGLKASVVIGTVPKPDVFHGSVTFKIEFMESGGIGYIGFEGEAFILAGMDATKETATVYAGVRIDMDFVNKTYMSTLTVHMNVLGIVRGAHENNRAGTAVMYFAPDDWHIYMGTPNDRIAILILGMVRLDSYFCMGTQIPDMPPPPAQVSEILGGMDLDLMRDESALEGGGGFAFGASLSISTGEKSFLMFYGSFDLGIGFDIMLKDYGKGVRCKGRAKNLGMNGWYASGQMYVYVQGEIGIKIRLFGKRKKFSILKMGMAAVLQAKLPNPSYMRGVVGGYYNILGGLIKGTCKFELEIGEQCEIVGGTALSGISVISDISPSSGASGVNVFSSPQVSFNFEINKTFELIDVDDKKKSFRAVLDHFDVTHDGKKLTGTHIWNADNTVLAFETDEVMPGKSKVKARVKIHFEESTGGGWKRVVVDGKEQIEEKEIVFTTGENPDNIPKNNVRYSYPIDRMVNLYKKEHPQGYIKLIKGQATLFEPSDEYTNELRFVSNAGVVKANFNYNKAERTLYFDIPKELKNNTIYSFNLVKMPKSVNRNVDSNVTNKENTQEGGVTVTTKQLEGTVELVEEKMIYDMAFRVSYYDTFIEKMKSLNKTKDWRNPIVLGVMSSFGTEFSGNEGFGKYECEGDDMNDQLIHFVGDYSRNKWFKKEINPILYDGYPFHNDVLIDWRDVSDLGIPPYKAIYINMNGDDMIIDDDDIRFGSKVVSSEDMDIISMVTYNMYYDYYYMKTKAFNIYLYNKSNSRVNKLAKTFFHNEYFGKYKYKAIYVLPGIKKVTSEYKMSHEI